MTKYEVIAQMRATALNKILKIYHPLSKISYGYMEEEGSASEQRDQMVRRIVEDLNGEIKQFKHTEK